MSDMTGHKYKCPNNDKNRRKKIFYVINTQEI